MPRKGHSRKPGTTIVAHSDNPEVLLIRVGHFLWRQRQQAIKNHDDRLGNEYLKCCQVVWAAKEAYRAPQRERNEQNRQAKSDRMRGRRLSQR